MRRAGTSSREGTTLAKEETNNKGDKGVKREELLTEHTHACTYTHTQTSLTTLLCACWAAAVEGSKCRLPFTLI